MYGRDVLEFLLKPEGVTNRGWEGDTPGVLVTYRTSASEGQALRLLQPRRRVPGQLCLLSRCHLREHGLHAGRASPPWLTGRPLPFHCAAQAKYIWPIQQPLGDFGAQRKRLQALRERLGWQVVGCELLECYQ